MEQSASEGYLNNSRSSLAKSFRQDEAESGKMANRVVLRQTGHSRITFLSHLLEKLNHLNRIPASSLLIVE